MSYEALNNFDLHVPTALYITIILQIIIISFYKYYSSNSLPDLFLAQLIFPHIYISLQECPAYLPL